MPWGVAASVAGSVIGGALAPSTGSSSAGAAYVPYNQSALDQSFNQYYGQYGSLLGSYYNNTNALATNLLNSQYSNPQASNYLSGAQQAQNSYYGAGGNATNAGYQDYNLGGQLSQASTNWGLTGSELSNLQGQSADTANAQSYLRGVQNSPYGAANATNAVDNTNLSYAQQQASTQAALAGAATSAYGAGTQQMGTAANNYASGSSLPYNAQSSIYGGQNNALTSYYGNSIGNYLQGYNQLQGNALQYLGYGNTAQNTAANQALASSQNQQGIASGITSGIASAGNNLYNSYYGSSSPSYGFSTGSSVLSSPSTYDYYGSGLY